MSSAPRLRRSAALAAFGWAAACAGGSDAPPQPDLVSDAEVSRGLPATAEERTAANRSDPLTRATFWADEHAKNPADLEATVQFARALRAIGSHDRAAEIAGQTLALHPDAYDLVMVLGRAQLSAGAPELAAKSFQRAVALAPQAAEPHAALGLAHDQANDHAAAQSAYRQALARDPGRVSTLSNLGLSLALTGDLKGAEEALVKAAASPDADVKVRQNLALVLGLQGRFDEMAAMTESDASATLAKQNAAALRAMIGARRSPDQTTQPDNPTALRGFQ